MKPLKEKNLRDLRAEMIENKKEYVTKAMEFRQKILEEKQRSDELRKQKSK